MNDNETSTGYDAREALSRSRLLWGEEAAEKLSRCRVAVFGLGGVGGYAAEALARSGIGALDLVDGDVFSVSNLNRQLFASIDTLGQPKTEAAAARISGFRPDCRLRLFPIFFEESTRERFSFAEYDYVVDAIDSVRSKLLLIACCREAGVPLICSMGTGGKLDPSRLCVTDIYQTQGDPLARVMRHECRRLGVERLQVVCSTEAPLAPMPASGPFVPPAAGLLLASRVVRELMMSRLDSTR